MNGFVHCGLMRSFPGNANQSYQWLDGSALTCKENKEEREVNNSNEKHEEYINTRAHTHTHTHTQRKGRTVIMQQS